MLFLDSECIINKAKRCRKFHYLNIHWEIVDSVAKNTRTKVYVVLKEIYNCKKSDIIDPMTHVDLIADNFLTTFTIIITTNVVQF